MRDAQSKLDQVIAFTGDDDRRRRRRRRCSGWSAATCCSTSLEAVADEDAPAAFALAGRAVEIGLRPARSSCRELSRVVRDLLVLSVDPSRVDDPEIAGEGERERLLGAGRPLLARGPAARVRPADAAPRTTSAARRSRAITSRWRCCGGCTCASWCRSTELIAAARDAVRGAPRPARSRAAAPAVAARRRTAPAVGAAAQAPPPCQRRAGAPTRAARHGTAPSAGRTASPARRRRRRRAGRAGAGFKDALLAEIQQVEGRLLQHGRRAGAEDRGRRRPRRRSRSRRRSATLREQFEQNAAVARSDGASRWPAAR